MAISLYVHIPFCVSKCRYCDFLSGAHSVREQEQYVAALEQEILIWGESHHEEEIFTCFFGGGTPSMLTPEQILRLCKAIRSTGRVESDLEWTMEMNPESVTREKLLACQAGGINRLSFGLQSADDRELALLGRAHRYDTFLKAFQMAREMGFDNINVDIMSALPGQTPAGFLHTLEQVLALEPAHLSVYSLIIEEGTPFYTLYGEGRGEKEGTLPTEEQEAQMDEITRKLLPEKGYERYEISNYARPGFACRHNQVYWQCRPYRGFGIGAASFEGGRRFRVREDLSPYLLGHFQYVQEDGGTPEERKLEHMEEFCFMGLRQTAGISLQDFFLRFGKTFEEVYGQVMGKLIEEEMAEKVTGKDGTPWLRLTEEGLQFSNPVLAQFLLT